MYLQIAMTENPAIDSCYSTTSILDILANSKDNLQKQTYI